MTTATGLNPATDLYPIRDRIRCAAAAHHAEDNARGREAAEEDPANPNHSRAAAARRIQACRERIAEDTADLAVRLVHHTCGQSRGVRWRIRLMERVAEAGREVAYWEGVQSAARH